MMTDPIADLLTRVRNAIAARHTTVTVPNSKMKRRIAEILKVEGYLDDIELIEEGVQGKLKLHLRYHPETGESPVHGLKRMSRPGRRVYAKSEEMPEVLGGLGIAIVSTSKGVMTGREARAANIGGEVLCKVW